jgi:predicted HAD superfamily hydrolase
MYSFDVFDTLITRRTATPKGIFALMQRKLYTCEKYQAISEYIVANFYDLRINAEMLARANNQGKGIEEVNLDDIYQAMALTGCLSSEDKRILAELEKATELENVVGITENIEKVKSLISQGEEVILLSDMYLDKDTVRKMLIKADPVFKELPLYISSEYRLRKTSGNLYRHVKELLQLDYSSWTHCGDNAHQDIEIPYELGITVRQYKPEPLSRLEDELIRSYGNNALIQLTAGVARIVRQANGETYTAEKIGSSLGGPVLYYYAEWVLERCAAMGIKRLYFIARDGYLIKNIIDILLKYKDISIDTCYIYGSRRAWRIPSLSGEDFNLQQILHWSNKHMIRNIEDLANVLMLTPQELFPFLPEGCRSSSVKLTVQTTDYLIKKLEKDKSFRDYMLAKLSPQRKLIREYLRQEIDFSDDNFAFVDMSGGGLTQGCLKKLLKRIYDKPIRTFFYKMDRINLMEGCIYDVFIPSFLKNSLVLEMISRAPHGQTSGYRIHDGKVAPVIDDLEEKDILNHGFLDYQKGVLSFAEQMAKLKAGMHYVPGLIDMVIRYINYIAEKPDDVTLDFFASFPSSETGREKELLEFAPRLSREDIENIYLKRTTEYLEDYYKGSYFDYSLLRCSTEELEYIEECKREYHSARGRLLRQDKEQAERSMLQEYGRAGRFPCEILEKNIILYGAGKFGQGLYKKITGLGTRNIILWVDKDYIRYNKAGLEQVQAPEAIGTKEYDHVVIAVADKMLAGEIQRDLLEKGVSEDKILWMDTNPYIQNYLN